MEDTSFVRFPGSLDPGAQEFRPSNQNQIPIFGPPQTPPQLLPPSPSPHQVYYPYPPPPISEVVPYAPFSAPAAYVSAGATVCAPLPPPTAAATRAVLLNGVSSDVSEGTVRRELEGFGEVRWVQMERACDGIVTVHFYDLRHAERALREIREQYMQQEDRIRNHYAALSFTTATSPLPPPIFPLPFPPGRGLIAGQAVWAQFVFPALKAVLDGHNQGTIVIFHLDPAVTTSALKDIFQAFGAVKELRETPSKKHQKFIEFFDVRDAARALEEMNGKEINGKSVVIQFSRPGGHSRKFFNAVAHTAPTLLSPHNLFAPLPPAELAVKFSRRSNSFRLAGPQPRLCTSSSQIQFSSTRSDNRSSSSSSSKGMVIIRNNVESKMAGLNLDAIQEKRWSSSSKKMSCGSSQSLEATATSPKQPKSSRGKKGRQAKKLDSKFLIKEDALSESTSGDTRTTVMIKNIPNKYSQKLLLNMLDNHCIHCNEQIISAGDHGGGDDEKQPFSSYDFVYLPIDFNNKCNVGYGFVNMTTPQATWRLYKAFHHQHWEVFNSRKICQVTYARVQGLEALKEHFKNSKFPCDMEHYLPVVFSPPRDGKQLTEPLPSVGLGVQINNKTHSSTTSSSSSISLLLPPPHHHDIDYDAPVSACDTDDDSSQNGGAMVDDDDEQDRQLPPT
ncbi:protein terminal ear1-like [Malus sylvestris]|uniref:protein terminal ear1-like n=1 Tax=Malus sylvestris TaxID=3752 RepID=UPI0021ABAEC7|nr:protein terminal ear1-like [Malus sylvestris]